MLAKQKKGKIIKQHIQRLTLSNINIWQIKKNKNAKHANCVKAKHTWGTSKKTKKLLPTTKMNCQQQTAKPATIPNIFTTNPNRKKSIRAGTHEWHLLKLSNWLETISKQWEKNIFNQLMSRQIFIFIFYIHINIA